MSTPASTRVSRRLSWLLRHGAGAVGLDMDAAGWVPVAQVLAAPRISRAELEAAVRTNDKGRLQLAGDRVRAMTRFDNSVLPWFGLPRSLPSR